MVFSKLNWGYGLFRIIIGILFFLHGYAKLFGWMGNPGMTGDALMLIIGIAELLIGAGLALGIFSKLAAAGGAVIMIGAIVMMHLSVDVLNPGNERPWLFLASFLAIVAQGNGNWALEKLITKKKKEIF